MVKEINRIVERFHDVPASVKIPVIFEKILVLGIFTETGVVIEIFPEIGSALVVKSKLQIIGIIGNLAVGKPENNFLAVRSKIVYFFQFGFAGAISVKRRIEAVIIEKITKAFVEPEIFVLAQRIGTVD